jgi:hypothetical protein
MSSAKLLVLAIAAAIGTTAIPTPSLADRPEPLFAESAQAEQAPRGRVRRAIRGALKHKQLRLNLGVGPDVIAVRERSRRASRRAQGLDRAHRRHRRQSSVMFAEVGNAVAGSIRHRGRLYKLIPGAEGTATLAEVDSADPLPSGTCPIRCPICSSRPTPAATAPKPTGGQLTGNESIIDVLVAYSPEAKAANGGQDGIEA